MSNKSVVHNVVANGILSVFNVLLPLIVTPYVYRVFGPVNIGSYEYSYTIFGYFSILGLLGIYDFGVRSISANRDNPDIRDSIFKNLLIVGIISNLIVTCCYVIFIYYFIHDSIIKYISYILCINILSQTFQVEWFNVGMEEFKFITEKTIIIRLINVVGIFTFINSPNDILLYAGFSVGVVFLNYLVSFIYVLKKIKRPLGYFFKKLDLGIYIYPLLIILILKNSSILYTLADRLLLGYTKGTEDVAYFSIGQKIVEMSKALLMSVVFATMPRLSYYLQTDKRLYEENIKKVIRLVTCLAIPMGIGLFCLSDQVVIIFGGSSFTPATAAMRVFSIRVILSCIETIMYSQILFLHGKEKRLLLYNVICGIINVSLNLILLKYLSPFISILCTFISEIIFNSLVYLFIRNNLKIKTELLSWPILRYLLISILFIPIVETIRFFSSNMVIIICLSCCICICLYVGILAKIHDRAYIELKEYVKKVISPLAH